MANDETSNTEADFDLDFGQESTTPVEGSETLDGTTPDEGTIDAKEQAEVALRKQLLDTKRKLTELGQANAEMRGKLSVLVKPTESTQAEENVLASIKEEDVRENPFVLVEALKKREMQLVGAISKLLDTRDAFFQEQIKKVDPEVVSLRQDIEALKEDEDYATLPDDVLVVIARKQRKELAESGETRVPGRIPAGRRPSGKPADIRESGLFKMVYGDRFKEAKK